VVNSLQNRVNSIILCSITLNAKNWETSPCDTIGVTVTIKMHEIWSVDSQENH